MSKSEIFTDKEISEIGSRLVYWDEVSQRTDRSPLDFEANQFANRFGHKLVSLLKEHLAGLKDA